MDPKQFGGGKSVFHLKLLDSSSSLRKARAGTPGRNLGAGTESEIMEEHILPTHSQGHFPKDGTA